LQKINEAFPPPDGWVDWDFWENYCSKKDFLYVIEDIHLNQNDDKHLPYPEARDFLAALKEHDFHIIIASHRTVDSIEQTRSWLLKHELYFDEIHLSYDKTVLIDATCDAVVDDAPHILETAAERGVTAAGLLFPWNSSVRNNGYRLCMDLQEILRYLLSCEISR
jgi:hypothetical protein